MNRFAVASLILGALLLVAGLGWIYRPLGPISAGFILLTAAYSSMRHKG